MNIPIIYEDSDILVIEKPAGLVVNRAQTQRGKMTLQDWIESRMGAVILETRAMRASIESRTSRSYPRQRRVQDDNDVDDEFSDRAGLSHRLDKETSGILLISKNPEAFENVKNQFKDRLVEKEYLALVHGRIDPQKMTPRSERAIVTPIDSNTFEVSGFIGRNPYDRMRFSMLEVGRESETVFRVEKVYRNPISGEPLTLLRAFPKTGRTHQLRVHLFAIGHPVVSDETYTGYKQSGRDRRWCHRLFLHAAKLSFNHPRTGARMGLESDLPEELAAALRKLGANTITE